MGFIEYLRGRWVRLESPLGKEEVALRINRESGSVFWPFSNGVKGGVYLGHLGLFYVEHPLIEYGAKPVLAGRLRDSFGSCHVDAKFRAPMFSRVFFGFWYLFLTFFVVALIAGAIEGRLEPGASIAGILLPVFFVAPLVLHYLFVGNHENALEAILDHLEQHTRLVPRD